MCVPAFLDGHIHIESSMTSQGSLNGLFVPHGTTAVITDPHEIANVAGTAGIRFYDAVSAEAGSGCVFYAAFLCCLLPI